MGFGRRSLPRSTDRSIELFSVAAATDPPISELAATELTAAPSVSQDSFARINSDTDSLTGKPVRAKTAFAKTTDEAEIALTS